MSTTATTLTSALDEVDYGFIVLNAAFQAQFVNRAFYRIWDLPVPPAGATYSFADIVEHGRRTGLYKAPPGSVQDYVRQRKGWLRLATWRPSYSDCKSAPWSDGLLGPIKNSLFAP